MNLEVDKRVSWVKRLVKETGAKGIVIGLSGGKDSAAVAAICVKAGIPVLGVNLPISSNPEDMRYVEALRQGLTAKYPQADFRVEYLSLNPPFDQETKLLDELFNSLEKGRLAKRTEADEKARQLALANTKARLRMTTLYAIANRYNYLVAGTDNACESFVGYFTKWGDGCFDFNLLGDLTVDEVIEAGIEAGAPEMCMKRTPSAGLWEGQTDEGEMGVTYKDIATVLKAQLLGNHDCPASVSPEVFAEIMRRNRTTEHKRRSPPSYDMYEGTDEDR
jgi:NAD+ synthase